MIQNSPLQPQDMSVVHALTLLLVIIYSISESLKRSKDPKLRFACVILLGAIGLTLVIWSALAGGFLGR